MSWYVLHTKKISLVLSKYRAKLAKENITAFIPTCYHKVEMVHKGKTVTRLVEKPKYLRYIFVQADEATIRGAIKDDSEIGFVFFRAHSTGMCKPLIVPDDQMARCQRLSDCFEGEIRMTEVLPELLVKGDKVRITGGSFAGEHGILISSQGKDGGKVLIQLFDSQYAMITEERPEDIIVEEFASSSHHLYQKLNSLDRRLDDAENLLLANQPLTQQLTQQLSLFVRRYSEVNLPTTNARVQMLCSLMLCNLFLGHTEQARAIYDELKGQLVPQLKSDRVAKEAQVALERYNNLLMTKN